MKKCSRKKDELPMEMTWKRAKKTNASAHHLNGERHANGWMDRDERAIEEEKNNKKKNGAFEGLSFNHSAHPHCSSSCCWLVIVLVQ